MGKQRPIIQCRYCKVPIDRDHQDDWVERSRGWTYHKDCYEKILAAKQRVKEKGVSSGEEDEDTWLDSIYDLLKCDLKCQFDWRKIMSQWEHFLRRGTMTPKGIYFAVKYYYDIRHGDPKKSEGGIGIVPYIYEEAAQYWYDRNLQETGILESIERQVRARVNSENRMVRQKRAETKKRISTNFAEIAASSEWED